MATGAPTAGDLVAARLRGGGLDLRSYLLQGSMLLALLVSLGILLVLLSDIAIRALPVLPDHPLDFLTSTPSSRPAHAGIIQGLLGSFVLVVFVALFALPVGVGAAVYLEEYAHDTRLTRFIRTNIRNLAGVPAIVYGLLGLAVFVSLLGMGKTLLVGGMTLAILVLPIVVITTSEALRAVPDSIREAALGVGATRWEMVRSHALPYAAPGILTGTILTLARAFGETAPLLMVGAVAGTFSSHGGLLEQLTGAYTALPTIVFDWARKPQAEFRSLTAATIVVLLTAILLRNRYDRKW